MTVLTPEYLQTQKYSALRDRLVLQHGGAIQPGVWGAGDFKVTQRASGTNMSVDVAGGYALVGATDPGNGGFYHVQNDATVNVTIPASNLSNPRLDQVVLMVNDTTNGNDQSDNGVLSVLAGAPSVGASLDTRTGAASLPASCIRIADVLVPPGAGATILSANIRDRRPWARGVQYLAGGTGQGNIATTNVVFQPISRFLVRVELSGVPVELGFSGAASGTPGSRTALGMAYASPAGVPTSIISDVVMSRTIMDHTSAGQWLPFSHRIVWTPTPGSYYLCPVVANNNGATTNIADDSTHGPSFLIRELVGGLTTNN